MKKILFSVLALLLLAGVASAAQIPGVVAPEAFPEIWTTEVYNNYSSQSYITSGYVVVWDFNSVSSPAAYTDRLNYVTLTTTADDIRVAGVVLDNSIPYQGTGTIAIKGPVYAYTADSADAVTASQAVATAGGNKIGQCGQAGSATVNTGILGYSIYAAPNTAANGGFGGTDGTDGVLTPIFVQPSNN